MNHGGKRSCCNRNTGFTLMELLVVMTMGSILLILGFKASGGMLKQRDQIICAQQLKQVYLAISEFCIENNNQFPKSINFDPYGQPPKEIIWYQKLPTASGVHAGDAWTKKCICPLNRTKEVISKTYVRGFPYVINYNLFRPTHPSGGAPYPPTLVQKVENLPQTIMMLDAKNNPTDWGGSGFNNTRSGWTRVSANHSDKATTLWADGRVTFEAPERIKDQNILVPNLEN